ncbi:hypothetical protein LSAT2_026105 [Lamellibrachia satsuma]|nr:hypothetical protein LSAT2_026105 [Lamellibrachia satsuma]
MNMIPRWITKLVLLVLLCACCEAWFLNLLSCGGKDYNPLRSRCCNGTIQPYLPSTFCCGNDLYYNNFTFHEKCVDGKVVK